MANDGGQVENEPPVGWKPPAIHSWTDPAGREHRLPEIELGPDGLDGPWSVQVELSEDLMMRVHIQPEVA
jgi:hypothetical protein